MKRFATMRRSVAALLLASGAAIAVPASNAAAQTRIQAGTLDCDISAGIGLIIGSSRQVDCVFTPEAGFGPREAYVGRIAKFGLDLGVTAGGQMIWGVYAETTARPGRAALAGTYSGASAEASVGLGLGANVLLGGSGRTVALQPLSVQGQAGINLAIGVSGLELAPAR
jgi:ribosomal protein S8E